LIYLIFKSLLMTTFEIACGDKIDIVNDLIMEFQSQFDDSYGMFDEDDEELMKWGLLGFAETIGDVNEDDINPYIIDDSSIYVEAVLKNKTSGELLHYVKDDTPVLVNKGREYPYEPDIVYSRLNFQLLPDVAENIWEVISNIPSEVSIVSMGSTKLEEKFQELDFLTVFDIPTVSKGDNTNVTKCIRDFFRGFLSDYLTSNSRVLWLEGDGSVASRYLYDCQGKAIPIDCWYHSEFDRQSSENLRINCGEDILYVDPFKYDILVANYWYYDYEGEILEILRRNPKIRLFYLAICPDETDELYRGEQTYNKETYFPSMAGLRAGFEIITKIDQGTVYSWCQHGVFPDTVWQHRDGVFSLSLYEYLTQGKCNGIPDLTGRTKDKRLGETFLHGAFKHYMFCIGGAAFSDVSQYNIPYDSFEVTIRSNNIYKDLELLSQQVNIPDGTYLVYYFGKVLHFCDVDLIYPYFVRRRWLQNYQKIEMLNTGFAVHPLATYFENRSKMSHVSEDNIPDGLIRVKGYGWNYSLSSMVLDPSKEGILFLAEKQKIQGCLSCEINENGLYVVEHGFLKLWLPHSYSRKRVDGAFNVLGCYDHKDDNSQVYIDNDDIRIEI